MTTVSSREICRMLAGCDDPERIRQKSARLNHWHKSGFFEALGCGATNPGTGRGGALEYPIEAKSYACLFDGLADGGASGYEIAVLVVSGFPIEEMQTGIIGRAMRGEEDVLLFWRAIPEGQTPLERRFVTAPAALPEGWPGGRWIDLTRVFARARQ